MTRMVQSAASIESKKDVSEDSKNVGKNWSGLEHHIYVLVLLTLEYKRCHRQHLNDMFFNYRNSSTVYHRVSVAERNNFHIGFTLIT